MVALGGYQKNFVGVLFVSLFLSAGSVFADSAQTEVKQLDIDGYMLEYVDKGSGEPVVFVHGAVSDYRTWGPYEDTISETARYVSYSRRHYGTQDWPADAPTQDDQTQHASDLVALIESLDAGAVHLVSWSNSGKTMAILGATRPDLIKSITQYEPVLSNVLMEGIEEAVEPGKTFNAGWDPVVTALENQDLDEAGRKLIEQVYEMPEGGFETVPEEFQKIVLDNARTIPLIFNDIPVDVYTCDYIGKTTAPTVVVVGQETNEWWSMMSTRVAECHENGQLITMDGVNHNGPIADVEGFSKIILDNVNKNM